MQFEAVPEHWFIGVPKFKYLTLRNVPEGATRKAMLYTGTADMIPVTVGEAEEAEAKGFDIAAKPGAVVLSYPAFYRLFAEGAKDLPHQDVRVRKALNLAINKQEILETIYIGRGVLKPTNYSMPSWCIGWDASKFPPVYPYDPEQAKRLLAEAGYPDGFKQTIYDYDTPGAPGHSQINQAIASYWKAIGLEIDYIPTEWGALRKMMQAGEAVYGSVGLQATSNRGYNGGIIPDYSTKDPGNYALNDELDKLTEDALTAETMEEFIERVQEWEIYIQEKYVPVPIAEVDELFGLSPKLKGWTGNAIRNDLNIRGMAMMP